MKYQPTTENHYQVRNLTRKERKPDSEAPAQRWIYIFF